MFTFSGLTSDKALSPPVQRGHQPTPAPTQKHAKPQSHQSHSYQTYHQKLQSLAQSENYARYKGRRIRRASSLQSDEEVQAVQNAYKKIGFTESLIERSTVKPLKNLCSMEAELKLCRWNPKKVFGQALETCQYA